MPPRGPKGEKRPAGSMLPSSANTSMLNESCPIRTLAATSELG
jgi:hypothetical protein